MRREVYNLPTEINTRTNVSHTMVNEPSYFSGTDEGSVYVRFTGERRTHSHISTALLLTDGMMMTTQHTETSGMVTRQITKEVVQRSVMGGTTVTQNMFYDS